MHAAGGQAQHHIACLDVLACENFGFFNRPDGKSGQVVFASGVHAGHLGRFAADQSATRQLASFGNAAHHGSGGVHIQFAAGEVVQKEKWLGPLDQHIVDAHRHQVDAHGVVHVPLKRQLELGTHAVCAADQYRFLVAFGHFKESAKTADASQHPFAHGFLGQGFDALHQRVACNDVDASVFVRKRGLSHGFGPHGAFRVRQGPVKGLAV